jgi:hypothetical protein
MDRFLFRLGMMKSPATCGWTARGPYATGWHTWRDGGLTIIKAGIERIAVRHGCASRRKHNIVNETAWKSHQSVAL